MSRYQYPKTADAFAQALRSLAERSPYLSFRECACDGGDRHLPIYVIQYRPAQAQGHGLISTGIHGEERAGPWAVLEFLRLLNERPEVAHNWELTILPLLNPFGFTLGQRNGPSGLDLNRGHVHWEPHASLAAWINGLHNSFNPAELDFVLSLHEDSDFSTFYLYSYELGAPRIGRECIDFMRGYYKIARETTIENVPVEHGLLVGNHDGSFEDWLSHRGVPRILVPEIPGKAPRKNRVETSLQVILFLLSRFRAGAGSLQRT